MEDRYLFRAKRIDNGEWVQGHLITDELDEKKCFIAYVFGTEEDGQPHDVDSALVDPYTICQCTGLKDKNGKLIWENDVVKCVDKNNDMEFTAIVEFGNPNGTYSWGYQLRHIKGYKPNLDILLWIDMEETGATCEVVGNVFDGGFDGKSSKEN